MLYNKENAITKWQYIRASSQMQKTDKKRIILIDLDGVLNQYKGKFDENHIPKIKPGAKKFIEKLSKEFKIKLFTTRNKILASRWLAQNDLDELVCDITNIKELCWLFIDDRCIQFDGKFKNLHKEISNFKPWYKIKRSR